MLSHEESTDLIDNTMAVLQADVPSMTPQSGKGILDQWIAMVGEAENTKKLVSYLETLKTQLESNAPAKAIEEVLQNLADQASELSTMLGAEGDISSRIKALASALRTLSGQLGNAASA